MAGTTTTTPPAGTTTTTPPAGTTTTTPPAGTTTTPALTTKINSASIADYDAITGGVYHLSNPGTIKINYNVSFTTNDVSETVWILVHLSNLQTIATPWNYPVDTQFLGQAPVGDNTGTILQSVTNLTGSIITWNDAAYHMIEPTAYPGIDYSKPTFLVVTLYAIDSSIPLVIGVPSTYVSSQVAIPITIVP